MKIDHDIRMPGMTGLGPAAWDRDEHKVSMHPSIPGHIEYVEEQMENQAHERGHHIVHRRHPEQDDEVIVIPHEVSMKDFQRTPHPHFHRGMEDHKSHSTGSAKQHVLPFLHRHRTKKSASDDGLLSARIDTNQISLPE